MPSLWDHRRLQRGHRRWSMMGSGSWNRVGAEDAGTTPAVLDAFSKSYQGWISPTPVLGPLDTAALPASASSPTAYRLLDNPSDVDWMYGAHRGLGEYFLVENRQLVGYDAGLPACGVIVYHVDERVSPYRGANARDGHRLVDVVEASGSQPLNDDYVPGLRRRRVPRIERARRLQRHDLARSEAVLRPSLRYVDARGRRLRANDGRELLRPDPQRRPDLGLADRRCRGHRDGWEHHRDEAARRTGRGRRPRRGVDLVPLRSACHGHARPVDEGVDVRHPVGRLPGHLGLDAERDRVQR